MSKILLASNEQSTSNILSKLLKTEGYKVVACSDVDTAKNKIQTEDFNLIISSASKGFDPDLSILKLVQSERPATALIVLLDVNDAETNASIAAYQTFAVMEKPLKVDKLLATVQKAVDFKGSANADDVDLNLQLEKVYQFKGVIAESPAMKSVCDMISRIAGIDVTILLAGESGTGKNIIAKTIHNNSPRKENNFGSVDCSDSKADNVLFGSAANTSIFEQCNNGTIFFREVSKLSASTQSKLFQVLKSGSLEIIDKEPLSIDVRVIASSSQDLEKLAGEGTFNNDLLKLLKVILIRLQPLRSRQQDIMPTIRMVLQTKIGEGKILPVFDQEVVTALEKYSWPANMDDIEKVLDHAITKMVNNRISMDALPAEVK